MWSSKRAVLALALLALAGCGFEPQLARRATGSTVDQTAAVKIDAIENRLGQELRNGLLDRLNPNGQPEQPLYHLQIKLTKTDTATAIGPDGNASRSNLAITAQYNLVPSDGRKPVLIGTSVGLNSYGIITNPYATVVGQKDAEERAVNGIADDIAARVSLYFARAASGQPQPAPTPPEQPPPSQSPFQQSPFKQYQQPRR